MSSTPKSPVSALLKAEVVFLLDYLDKNNPDREKYDPTLKQRASLSATIEDTKSISQEPKVNLHS
jgi:hypothetical protein